jgi:hypothetical protein
MKKGLTQICLGRDSSIRDALQMCREIGYQGLEILLTDSGELTMQSGFTGAGESPLLADGCHDVF